MTAQTTPTRAPTRATTDHAHRWTDAAIAAMRDLETTFRVLHDARFAAPWNRCGMK